MIIIFFSEILHLKVPFTGQPLFDIDSLIAFLSTEYPGIPPHIRRSPTGGKHPDNTIDQNGSIGQALEMIRSFEGRSVDIDLRYLGFGKLPELINKCKQVISFYMFFYLAFLFFLFAIFPSKLIFLYFHPSKNSVEIMSIKITNNTIMTLPSADLKKMKLNLFCDYFVIRGS